MIEVFIRFARFARLAGVTLLQSFVWSCSDEDGKDGLGNSPPSNASSDLIGASGVLIEDRKALYKSKSIRGLMAEVLEDYHERVGDERELLVLYAEKGGEMRSLVWVRRESGLAIGGGFFPYNESQPWVVFDVEHKLDDSTSLFTEDCGLLVSSWTSSRIGDLNINFTFLSGGDKVKYSSSELVEGVNCVDDLKVFLKAGSLLEAIVLSN